MAANIPDVVGELCAKPVFAHLATLAKDGGPQVTPVWIDFDGSLIWDQHPEGQDQGPEHAAR